MTRIIVHPGFHKTGTSSLQAYLNANATALAPYLTFYGKDDFPAVGTAARIYGQRRFPWRLRQFRLLLDRFLRSVPDAPVIVLSRETFSGVMPGHRRLFGRTVKDYKGAAVPLGHEIIAALRNRFGPDASIEFFYTLRDQDPWITSVYGHLLRSINLQRTLPDFRAMLAPLIDPQQEAEAIAARLSLDALHLVRLEDVGQRHEGPAAALLDLLDIPEAVRSALPPARRANIGQSLALQSQFLTLNQTCRDKSLLKRRKDQLIKEARR